MLSANNDFTPDNWGKHLVCPECGFNYIHLKDPIKKDGKDDYKAWRGRGDSIEIPMFCENDHEFTVVLGEHKGNVYLFIK